MKTKTKKQRRTQELMELLRITYILLMPCAQDIEGFNTMDVSKIYDVIDRAESDGFIRKFKAGQTFQEQMRIALTHKGINEVCSHFSLPLKQQFCARSHSENLARLRLNEPVMRLAPRLFRSGAIRTPFVYPKDPGDDPREVVLDESTALVDIDWLESTQDSNVHSIWWYRTTAGDTVAFPNITVGLHHMSARQEAGDLAVPSVRRLDSTAGLDSVPACINRLSHGRAPGVVFVVLDRLAGWFVQRHYAGVPKSIVDAEGNIIQTMNPIMPMGRIERPASWTGRVGLPEKDLDRLLRKPEVLAMQGVPQRKVFEMVNGIQGCNFSIIGKGVGHPESKVKSIVDAYEKAGLMVTFDHCAYLSDDGRVAAARRDRQHPNLVHGRFATLTADDPAQRLHDREHEQTVGRVKGLLKRAGIQAFPGWRLEITYPGEGGTQLRPDLWVLVPLGNGTALWHALEVERSAARNAAIDRKAEPLRIARDRGHVWPVLAVAGKGVRSDKGRREDMAAARRFAARCSDLPLLAIDFHQAAEGKMTGSEPAWLRVGETVPITHLSTMSTTMARLELIQRLGDRAW